MRGRRAPRRLVALGCGLLLGLPAACTVGEPAPARLRVLASADLADMEPLLGELRRETGVELVMDYRGAVRTGEALRPGRYQHDLAWLSSDRYFRLTLRESRFRGEPPLSTNTMLSPVVIGLRPGTAARLRRVSGNTELSWADIADGAAQGLVRFGMADPGEAGSGLAALVGVATAAADTGGALRAEDVTCDRLRGFFAGQTLSAASSKELTEAFVARQAEADGLIGHESVLLSLNASGRLRERLEIVYPQDGMVMSEYPLLLLDPGERAAYDRVVAWLTSAPVQKKIMDRTLRRPLDPATARDRRLRVPVGNALFFPDRKDVVDTLLRNYDDPKTRAADRILFLLDFSGSMRGARMTALESTFAGLGGADDSTVGRFVRFHRGEEVTVIRFGGRVLGERTFTVGAAGDMAELRDHIATGGFDASTAIWTAVGHASRRAAELLAGNPRRRVSIVLMTDGLNNAGITAADFLRQRRPRSTPVNAIRFGEADAAELRRVAAATGGRMVDANSKPSLLDAFKEIRGCR